MLLLGPYIYNVHTQGRWVLKFVTCLRIRLFLSNWSIVHFCGLLGVRWDGEGQNIGNFWWPLDDPFPYSIKNQKTSGFLMFPGDIEREHWTEMVKREQTHLKSTTETWKFRRICRKTPVMESFSK